MDIPGLWNLSKTKVEELMYLLAFGALEVKYDLDKTGKKNYKKRAEIACIGTCHRMNFLDLQQLDRWRNGCKYYTYTGKIW